MQGWNTDELAEIGDADEVPIGTWRRGTLVEVPIWVVRIGSDLFIRSFRGGDARWFTRAVKQQQAIVDAGGVARDVVVTPVGDTLRSEIDDAYRDKYGRYGAAYLNPMTAPAAVETTLKLLPR